VALSLTRNVIARPASSTATLQHSIEGSVTNTKWAGEVVRNTETFGDGRRQPSTFRSLVRLVLFAIVGAGIGVLGLLLWQHQWFANWNWMAVLAVAIFANVVAALVPLWREDRRRTRQAELLRFRLWIHFSKLRWLLTHLDPQDGSRTFFSPGLGGEELQGIEVLLAQAHLLEIPEYEWVIFTVNVALPFYGRPIAEVAAHATRLLWTVDATLAHLNDPSVNRRATAA
jgi:hypothetical protein